MTRAVPRQTLQRDLENYCRKKRWPIWHVTNCLSVIAASHGRTLWVETRIGKDKPQALLSLRELGNEKWLVIRDVREFKALYPLTKGD